MDNGMQQEQSHHAAGNGQIYIIRRQKQADPPWWGRHSCLPTTRDHAPLPTLQLSRREPHRYNSPHLARSGIVTMAKENVETLCQKAQMALAQGEYEAARQIYLQALGLKSDAPDVHYGLATVCFLLNDLTSASFHFKEVTRLDPLRAAAHINLGA